MAKKEKKKVIEHGRSTNFLLADGLKLTFNTNPYNKEGLPANGLGWIHNLVIGATGTGKSRYFCRPNIYSLPTDPITGRAISMVITDPKGELLHDTGKFLEAHGYVIKVLNLAEQDCSDCYNPMAYIRSEQDIAVLTQAILDNLGDSKKGASDHWQVNASYVIRGIISYAYYEMSLAECNFGIVTKLLNMWESSETDGFKSRYDLLIDDLRERKGDDHPAVVYRDKVSATGQELSSIISTASTLLGIFALNNIRLLTETDSLELDKVGDRPTALYLITPPTSKAFNFLGAVMYSQLFTLLQNRANYEYKDREMTLPHKVWFLLDEFANIGKIPDFDQQITLVRSAGIFVSIIVQSPSQIEAIYDKLTPTILSNCAITLFLGAPGNAQKDDSAADFISRNLGKMTIQAESTSVSYDVKLGADHISHSYAATERPLMTPDEVKRMPGDECIILLGGQKPIKTKKILKLEECMNYDIYQQIGNYDVAKEKSTKDTYKIGRALADDIEALQDECREKEALWSKTFIDIKAQYEREKQEEAERIEKAYEDAMKMVSGDDPDEISKQIQGEGAIISDEMTDDEIYVAEEEEVADAAEMDTNENPDAEEKSEQDEESDSDAEEEDESSDEEPETFESFELPESPEEDFDSELFDT